MISFSMVVEVMEVREEEDSYRKQNIPVWK